MEGKVRQTLSPNSKLLNNEEMYLFARIFTTVTAQNLHRMANSPLAGFYARILLLLVRLNCFVDETRFKGIYEWLAKKLKKLPLIRRLF